MSVQVKNIRNELFYSNTFKVNDMSMKNMITQMIKLLQHGILADDITAQNAVEDIKEVYHLHFASLYKYLLCLPMCIIIVLCVLYCSRVCKINAISFFKHF